MGGQAQESAPGPPGPAPPGTERTPRATSGSCKARCSSTAGSAFISANLLLPGRSSLTAPGLCLCEASVHSLAFSPNLLTFKAEEQREGWGRSQRELLGVHAGRRAELSSPGPRRLPSPWPLLQLPQRGALPAAALGDRAQRVSRAAEGRRGTQPPPAGARDRTARRGPAEQRRTGNSTSPGLRAPLRETGRLNLPAGAGGGRTRLSHGALAPGRQALGRHRQQPFDAAVWG